MSTYIIDLLKSYGIQYNNEITLSTGVTIIVTGVGAYMAYRAVEKRLRKEHTVDVLLRLLITPAFSEGIHVLDNHIARDLYIIETKLREDDNVGDPVSLDMVMDYYEFVASAYHRNYLDKTVIVNQKLKHFHDSFIVLEELIRERREKWDRPTYMVEFEKLAREFAPMVRKRLNIKDPLTRDKMARNPRNEGRRYTGKRSGVVVTA